MHDPYVREVSIARPPDLGGEAWNLTNLTNLVALFGKNGSGKSRLLRAWRDANLETTHYVVPERTGELDYQPNLLQRQLSSAHRREDSQRNFANEYRRQIVVRIQAYFAARGDFRGDVAPARPEEIEALLERLLPDFMVELSGTANPPYRIVRSADGNAIGNIDNLSSGEAQSLTLMLDVLTMAGIWEIQDAKDRVMLIDEPDAHLHPDLLARLADVLVQVAEKYKIQMIIATHSTALLAALGQFAGEHASVIYLDRIKSDFRAELFTDAMQELAACLGGHALMGPLFGVPLLLVEGDDDYRIWSQVPRYHITSFSVIPCGGEKILQYQRTLERMLATLREDGSPASGFALVDGDRGKPEENAETPQQQIRFIQLNCHEAENLYLADEVLRELDTTWDEVQRLILEKADDFGEKADDLRRVAAANRQNDEVKVVINQISEIVDPKHVHWTIRVAKVIGSERPVRQIADFLGQGVLEAFWWTEPITPTAVEAAVDAV